MIRKVWQLAAVIALGFSATACVSAEGGYSMSASVEENAVAEGVYAVPGDCTNISCAVRVQPVTEGGVTQVYTYYDSPDVVVEPGFVGTYYSTYGYVGPFRGWGYYALAPVAVVGSYSAWNSWRARHPRYTAVAHHAWRHNHPNHHTHNWAHNPGHRGGGVAHGGTGTGVRHDGHRGPQQGVVGGHGNAAHNGGTHHGPRPVAEPVRHAGDRYPIRGGGGHVQPVHRTPVATNTGHRTPVASNNTGYRAPAPRQQTQRAPAPQRCRPAPGQRC